MKTTHELLNKRKLKNIDEKLILERYERFVPFRKYSLIDDCGSTMYFGTNGKIVFKVDEDWEKPGFRKYICYLHKGWPRIERKRTYHDE